MVLRYSQCTVVLAALYSTLEGECGNSALVGECTGKRSDSADVDHFDLLLTKHTIPETLSMQNTAGMATDLIWQGVQGARLPTCKQSQRGLYRR